MPKTTCQTCFNDYAWRWEDAFDKFGFNDGDGQVMTADVVDVLERAGYRCETGDWLLHNTVISAITKDGSQQIPATANVGYDDPRGYLPEDIVRLLDEKLPEGEVVA